MVLTEKVCEQFKYDINHYDDFIYAIFDGRLNYDFSLIEPEQGRLDVKISKFGNPIARLQIDWLYDTVTVNIHERYGTLRLNRIKSKFTIGYDEIRRYLDTYPDNQNCDEISDYIGRLEEARFINYKHSSIVCFDDELFLYRRFLNHRSGVIYTQNKLIPINEDAIIYLRKKYPEHLPLKYLMKQNYGVAMREKTKNYLEKKRIEYPRGKIKQRYGYQDTLEYAYKSYFKNNLFN